MHAITIICNSKSERDKKFAKTLQKTCQQYNSTIAVIQILHVLIYTTYIVSSVAPVWIVATIDNWAFTTATLYKNELMKYKVLDNSCIMMARQGN